MHYKIWQTRKHKRQPRVNPQKSGDTVFRNDRLEKKMSMRVQLKF